MDLELIMQQAQDLLQPYTERVEHPEPDRLDVYIMAEQIAEAVGALVAAEEQAGHWHLITITGLDIPQTEHVDGQVELLYHFCQKAMILTLRARVDYGSPTAPSICGVIPAATLYEREVIEMFGVIFDGTPSRDRLLLPDDWPDWVYPLRKSFQGLE
jgi:NADH:ubiquinone oxidoreductase subunit C